MSVLLQRPSPNLRFITLKVESTITALLMVRSSPGSGVFYAAILVSCVSAIAIGVLYSLSRVDEFALAVIQASPMSIFSRMFRSPAQRQFKRMLDEVDKKTDKQFRPLRNLSLEIVKASTSCRDQAKSLIEASTERERQNAEIFAFYEFLYFFLHLTMREAFAVMTEAEIMCLQRHLGPLIIAAAMSPFEHWPDDLKIGMTKDFYTNLNRAELTYAECSRFDSPSPPGGRSEEIAERLFNGLGDQVASAIGREGQFECSLLIANIAIKEWHPLDLRKYVEDFKRDSMDLPPPPYHP